MVFLDTNVVLRLLMPDAAEYDAVTRAVDTLESRGERLVLGLQVLVELWVVATRPRESNGLGWGIDAIWAATSATRERFTILDDDAQHAGAGPSWSERRGCGASARTTRELRR